MINILGVEEGRNAGSGKVALFFIYLVYCERRCVCSSCDDTSVRVCVVQSSSIIW